MVKGGHVERKGRKVRLAVDLDPASKRELKVVAAAEGISVTAVVTDLIEKWVAPRRYKLQRVAGK